MTPRKRKRSGLNEDPPSTSSSAAASQPPTSRLGAFAFAQKKPAARTARSRARSTEKEAAPSPPRGSSRKQRTSSPAAPAERVTRRRATSVASRTPNEPRIESPTKSRRRTSVALAGRSATASRTTASSRRNKGKARASQVVDFETSSQVEAEDPMDAGSSVSGTRRGAKRRRLSPPPSFDMPESSTAVNVDVSDVDGQETTVADEDFQMSLDMPDDVTLPWVPMDPASKESAYVPPGLNALIEDMKRALVLQMSACQKAEARHAEELQRRRKLEQEAARLAAANRALEAERSAWTTNAAEALACTIESALSTSTDVAHRRAAETPPGAFIEELADTPEGQAQTQTQAQMQMQTAQMWGVQDAMMQMSRALEAEVPILGPGTDARA
ncbi:hypothetical protein C8Q77DRAFT_1152257 [Trametes polyzona]|nr:hypothetical protein C8Q77DRAFT_1152257 [Trametes polyzona]